jgi:methyl-accepting chemotaxis protein
VGRALPFRTSDNGIVKKMDVEKTIEFLLNNQAKHDERLSRLETVVGTLAGSVGSLAGSLGSLAGSVDKLADNIERLDEAMVTLAESGVQTNRRIDQLGMRVDQLVSAMGAMMQRPSPPPNVG